MDHQWHNFCQRYADAPPEERPGMLVGMSRDQRAAFDVFWEEYKLTPPEESIPERPTKPGMTGTVWVCLGFFGLLVLVILGQLSPDRQSTDLDTVHEAARKQRLEEKPYPLICSF